jgi:single-strand DNA-binding protein
MNRVFLVGRLTADPELRNTPSGTAVVKFTLAVDRRFKNKNGDKEADFVQITAWSKLAETVANYLKKGNQAAVSGRLQIRSYDDSRGVRRKAAEVVADEVKFLSFNGNNGNNGNGGDAGKAEEIAEEINEDDIPF